MNRYFSTKGGGGGGITSYYILLQHLQYFSSEDEVLFSRFKSEMEGNEFFYLY